MINVKKLSVIGLILSLVFLGLSYLIEIVWHVTPCPLCLMQRLMLGFVCLVFLLQVLRQYYGRGIVSLLIVNVYFIGAGLALVIRQIYLQLTFVGQPETCLPGTYYMLQHFPAKIVLKAMLLGTGHCGEIEWHFLGISMAWWSLIAFISLLVIAIVQLTKNVK